MSSDYFWTPEQKEVLKQAYTAGGLKEAERLFPDKKRGTIATQASRLQITRPRPRKAKR